jgi:hypothetical protein
MVRRNRYARSCRSFWHPLFLNIDSLDASVHYGISDRVSLTLTMPFSRGTHSRFYADGVRHTVQASGLGETSMQGNIWLRSPIEHPEGNFAVGFGLKTPSGNNDVVGDVFLANGSITKALWTKPSNSAMGAWESFCRHKDSTTSSTGEQLISTVGI